MLVVADSATGSSDGRLAEARKANRPIRPARDATGRMVARNLDARGRPARPAAGIGISRPLLGNRRRATVRLQVRAGRPTH
jgi:hypothetical protein